MSYSEPPISQPFIGSDNTSPILDSIDLNDPKATKPDIFALLAGAKKSGRPKTTTHLIRRAVIWLVVFFGLWLVPAILGGDDLGNTFDNTLGNPTVAPILGCFFGVIAIIGLLVAAIIGPFLWVKSALNKSAYERAISRSQFIKSIPKFRAIGLFLEGTSHSFAGNWVESERALRENIRLVGEQLTASTALENLGNVLVAQGRYSEAVQSYERAIAIEPATSGAYNGLAEVYLYQGLNPERAFALADKALEIKLNPQQTLVDAFMVAEMLMNKAWALQLMGKTTYTDETIKQAFEWAEMKFKPVLAGLYFRNGKIMQLRGKGIEARQFLHQAIETDPDGAYGKLARQTMREM